MNQKLKIIIIALVVIFLGSVAWFDFVFIKNNANTFERNLDAAGEGADVVIIFNSGGWGTVPLEKAFDFNPIIDNTKALIESYDYKVSVVPYYRTKENFLAHIASLKEIFFGFPDSSRTLAQKIDFFLDTNPGKRVILAGLSNGASFVNATMEDIKNKKRVAAIEFGAPFSAQEIHADNILAIVNSGDAVAHGEVGQLFWSALQSPFVYFSAIIQGKPISYSQAIIIQDHLYSWEKSEGEVRSFLRAQLN